MKVNNFIKRLLLLAFGASLTLHTVSQETGYKFSIDKRNWTTSVKNQGRTGTCWSFAATSFLESEIKRINNMEVDLAEMFIVRHSYQYRAELYVRYHGHLNFGPGAQAWDAMDVLRSNGIVPKSVYEGNLIGSKYPMHGEMDAVLSNMMDAILKNRNRELTPVWQNAVSGVLDAYLGNHPESFSYGGEQLNPQKFAEKMGLDADNYMAVTSFNHHPYHTSFVFESPDNWSSGLIYNLPLDELIETMDKAILAGHTIVWSSDVSDPGMNFRDGVAIVPQSEFTEMTEEQKQEAFLEPVEQKEITPGLRQQGYDNWNTTDDHSMHMVGIAHDQKGTKYYIVKNSWGTDNPYDGYFYASEAYVRLRTMSILINKEFVKFK